MSATEPPIVEGGLGLRRAGMSDVPLLAALADHPAVEPFMSALATRDTESIAAAVERSQADPGRYGRFVIEQANGPPVGALGFECQNERSRIVQIFGVMVAPQARGAGLGGRASALLARHLIDELDYHRVQLECYGFNAPAVRVFERAGFTREGLRRAAYWRHGRWADGVMFGLVAEDLAAARDPG